jgi:hypothetical protein
MRNNHQKQRMRGRNRNGGKSQNPLSRVYESNGPDVKVRGTAHHITEKYMQLARDAQSSGDHVGAENYFQHAEHYFRIVVAAQEQYRQINPNYRPETDLRGEEEFEDDEEPGQAQMPGANGGNGGYETGTFGLRDPQPFLPAEQPGFVPRDQPVQGEGQPRYERRPDRRDDHRRDHQRRDDRRDDQRRDDRPNRFDRPRQERFDRGDRPERQDRGDRPDRGERFDRGERGDRPERGERFDRPDRDRPDRDRFERRDRPERTDRPERSPEQPVERAPEPALDALPAFITGGVAPAPAPAPEADEGDGQERSFRPRRRRRGPRGETGSDAPAPEGSEGNGE